MGRSVVATTQGIVAASQPLAARAGVQILERGGNAIDAAIAANATIGLMEPTGNGLGGDLFIIYYEAKTGTVHGLNSSGWAPTGLTVDFLASKGIKEMPQRGIYSVTVPGVAAGWHAMRERFGTKPLSELLAPAIWYAENGFPGVGANRRRSWAGSVKMHSAHPNSRKTYLIDGERAPKAGEIFKNPDLAGTLRLIAEKGRDGYYRGKTAEAIVQISREQGGTFTLSDLSEFTPEWTTPIKTTYRGWTIHEIGPQTQGISALMMLNLMEQYPLGDYGFHSPNAMHVMIEAKKLAYADMLRYIGDPRFSKNPVDALLSKPRAIDRAKLINTQKAACSVEPAETHRHYRRARQRHHLHVGDRQGRQHRLVDSEQLQRIWIGSGAAGHRFHAAKPGRTVLTRTKRAQHAPAAQTAAAHDHSRVHGEGRREDRVRDHGRLEPGSGPRAVCSATSPTTA